MNKKIAYICEICGKENLESHKKCDKHQFLLCNKCTIIVDKKILCPEEIREMIPISRDQFKILLVIINEIKNKKDIENITKISSEKISKLIQILLDNEFLIDDKNNLVVSHNGELAIRLYSQFFGDEKEMDELDEEVIKYVKSR